MATAPITLAELDKTVEAVKEASESNEERFAAVEKGLETLSSTVDSIAAAVKANAEAPAQNEPSSVQINADGSTETPEVLPASFVAAIMQAAEETDPEKRKAAVKKAMGDHGKDMAKGRKASADAAAAESQALAEIRAEFAEYREAARTPLLDKLASFYPESMGDERKALMASFKDLPLADLKTEVAKASAIAGRYGGLDDGVAAPPAGGASAAPSGYQQPFAPGTLTGDNPGSGTQEADLAFVASVVGAKQQGAPVQRTASSNSGSGGSPVSALDIMNATMKGRR